MPGVTPRFDDGPVTYEVVEAVAGGLLVEARAASKIGVCAAASVKCLGIATKDATPPASSESTDAFGNPVLNTAHVTEFVAVDGNGAIYPVTYAANAAFGDKLIAAAGGKVTPAGATPDARTIVGECREPAGVTSAGTTKGLAKIY